MGSEVKGSRFTVERGNFTVILRIMPLLNLSNEVFLDSRLRGNDLTPAILVIPAKAGIQTSSPFESEHIFENWYSFFKGFKHNQERIKIVFSFLKTSKAFVTKYTIYRTITLEL